ncbi:hypothetical protein SARC_16286 [Sphaeroforma arctica JP610]|uniref:Uncharacterized protein n=1 Tax=Sphaeroforma arctica JP610 TaxID=667725 RepID=A0A0L0F372_9EUKA|nr:hypothetical protein SARC_16286 [Sphaeroforma arctica JP610]KNC71175.1 hypothetical protein SARC_16286 [Sphaeroforma arctica JP610]|eukprot:XP_014145077.1 hypothetical protein SARC_16286 [Sphaeroforma arctica JP610]
MPRPGAASSSAVSVDKKPAATDTPTATSATWWRYTGLSSAFASTPNTSEPKVTNAPSPARTLETAVSDTGTVPVCDTEPAAVERALQARGAGQGWLSGWGYRTGKPSVKLD